MQSKYRLSRERLQVTASHRLKMFDHDVGHGKDSEVVGGKNFACVPAPLWIWPRAMDPSVLASMALDIFVSLTWQYDPNSRWPSTFALKGRPYRI